MRKIVILLSLIFALNSSKVNAQITDSLFVKENIKPYLYDALPNGKMLDSNGKEVDYIQYIKKKRPFKDKPTLFLTWSNKHCPSCVKLIDSILDHTIHKRYNVVLINRDQTENLKESIDDITYTKQISDRHPSYNANTISLFDNHNLIENIDEGTVPMLFWMNKDLNIAAVILNLNINAKRIEKLLELVERESITHLQSKILDTDLLPISIMGDLTPESILDRRIKQTSILNVNENKGIYTFTWVDNITRKTIYSLNFIKNPKGYFVYDKSSLNNSKKE